MKQPNGKYFFFRCKKVSPTRSLSVASRNSMKNSTKKRSRFGRKSSFLVWVHEVHHAADGSNPAPPGMYKNLVSNGINYLSTGAGFLPSAYQQYFAGNIMQIWWVEISVETGLDCALCSMLEIYIVEESNILEFLFTYQCIRTGFTCCNSPRRSPRACFLSAKCYSARDSGTQTCVYIHNIIACIHTFTYLLWPSMALTDMWRNVKVHLAVSLGNAPFQSLSGFSILIRCWKDDLFSNRTAFHSGSFGWFHSWTKKPKSAKAKFII